MAYARSKGTIIVASAGNEHVRVGAGGRVIRHGQLSTPGDAAEDWPDPFGQFETPRRGARAWSTSPRPAGWSSPPRPAARRAPSATRATPTPTRPSRQTSTPPASRPATSTRRPGRARQNQLAYYSNYGPRIDLAGPGGARKFNLANFDRGGTPGFPYTLDDLTNAWEVFSTTSNWAVEIPCFTFTTGSGFPQGECYSTIQGTSMAAPQVVGLPGPGGQRPPVAAQAPGGADRPAQEPGQRQPAQLHAGPVGDRHLAGRPTGLPCDIGFCHLGGPRISDSDAYGAGLVNVANP